MAKNKAELLAALGEAEATIRNLRSEVSELKEMNRDSEKKRVLAEELNEHALVVFEFLELNPHQLKAKLKELMGQIIEGPFRVTFHLGKRCPFDTGIVGKDKLDPSCLELRYDNAADDSRVEVFTLIRPTDDELPLLYNLADAVRIWGLGCFHTPIDLQTGLASGSELEKRLPGLIRTADADQEPLSMLMIDVDNFKTVNDTYGHNVGDRVLLEVATIIDHHRRAGDLVARIDEDEAKDGNVAARVGGDEVVVVLPNVEESKARIVGERIRKEVANREFAVRDEKASIRLTVSIGVATYHPGDGIDGEALVATADQRMYVSKRRGRNKITVAKPKAPKGRRKTGG